MRYIALDDGRMSVVGLGCWQFGEPGWGYGTQYSEPEVQAVVRRALELGVTVFDTAELYGRGASEVLLGRALRGWTGDTFLATKFLPVLPLPGVMVSHLEASLERLGVAAVDLYQLHFPNPAVPVPIQAEGLRRVLELGLTRHVGVSNFSLRRWSQTERALGRPVISNQVHYNLLQRKPERGLLEYAQRHSRVLLAYSPLAQGVLSGRYRAGALPDDRRRLRPLYSEAALAAATPLLEALSEIAAAHAAKPAQVALAYLLSHPRVVVIPGAKSVAQLEENVAAAEIELAQDEVQALRGASDRFHFSRARAVAEVLGRLSSGRRRTPA